MNGRPNRSIRLGPGSGTALSRWLAGIKLPSDRRPLSLAAMNDEIEQRVRRVLEGLGAPYEVITIDPAFADTAEFCAKYGYPEANSGNTIICASKSQPKQYAACVVAATTRLDV